MEDNVAKMEAGNNQKVRTWRSIKQDTTGRVHAELLELFGVHDRILDSLLKFFLGRLESTNVVPGNTRHFHDSLAKRRRVCSSKSSSEMLIGNSHRIQNLGVNGIILKEFESE